MVNLSAARGKEVRAQLGKNYYILPAGDAHCPWHRRMMTSEDARRFREKTGQNPSVSCEDRQAWWPDDIREEALRGLPRSQLPDWRQVVLVPAVARFGAVLPHEWRGICEAARASRGPLIEHAYEASLEILQRWQEIGIETMSKLDAREQRISDRRTEDSPLEEIAHADTGLAGWIYRCAPSLYYRHKGDDAERDAFNKRMKAFRPYEMALNALAAATGYAPSSIQTILRRSRGSRGRTRAKVTGSLRPAPERRARPSFRTVGRISQE
jgi:hypothetical protein